jgi:BirA family transcriptional regulator, biotin operon repressor / biotin---[acetyl-CoA-carboxylase] ligase
MSFSAADIRAQLDSNVCSLDIQVVDSIESTHGALLAAPSSPQWSALVAHAQTAGRGREGRVWLTPPNASLALSLRATLDASPNALSGLSVALGVALRAALIELGAGEALKLKWPNDLVVGEAKLGGMLVDLHGTRAPVTVIASVGINIALPSTLELDRPVTDLSTAFPNVEWRGDRLAAATLNAWVAMLASVATGGWRQWLTQFDAADALCGRYVQPRGESIGGIGCGIDAHGRLLLDVGGTLRAISAGELV